MKQILNLDFYSGQDLYSDGQIEDELLEILTNNDDLSSVLKKDDRWPILYHLSDIRHNLLDWYPFGKDSSVLEIGAGCGAITGVLCKNAGQVTCVELSKRRSMINAERNKKYDNFEIMVGNFEDIKIDKKFDYVTLIGVLEYSPSYIKSGDSFDSMLEKIKGFLKPNGKVIIAIENKFGLKYFAGASEDHTGKMFDGINNYDGINSVKTFTKKELTKVLTKNGFDNLEYYYPMPDYKLPEVIYSDEYLPKAGDLRNMVKVYDRDRFELFNEDVVYDQLCDDELIDYFANSFLVIGQVQ